MSDKTLYILKALFCIIIMVGCILSLSLKLIAPNQKYPYIGIALAGFLAIAFLRRAFEK